MEYQPEMAKQYVVEILSQPEFKTSREEYRLKYIGDSTQTEVKNFYEPLDFSKIAAQLFELLLWLALFIIIIRSSSIIKKTIFKLRPTKHSYLTPPLVEIKENKSLDSNIPQQVWQLWQAGDKSIAISLLYCSSLSALQKYYALKITDDITENECIKLVSLKQSKNLANYFIELAHIWQNIAYAGLPPDDNKVQELCRNWQQHFG